MSLIDHYYSLVAFAFILSGLFFAAVRWFHMCRPYDQEPEYYYPDRPMLTFFYFLPLFTFPYVLWPDDPDAWLLVKCYFPLTHLFICAVLIFNYFGRVKNYFRWRRIAILMSVPIFALLAMLLFKALSHSTWGPRSHTVLIVATIILSVLTSIYCLYAIRKLFAWLKQQNESDYYSNPDDFPSAYAKRIVFIPLFEFVVIWVVFFIDSRVAMAILQIVFVVFNIIFLISVLHPKRNKSPYALMTEEEEKEKKKEMEKEEEKMTAATATTSPAAEAPKHPEPQAAMPSPDSPGDGGQSGSGLPEEKVQVIVSEIKAFVEGEQQFLNPHLSIIDVAEHCGYGRTYVSKVLTNELGGFFHYINSLRLDYARQYREDHPYATQDEVATASGFSSRQTFYSVRRRMG